MKHAKSPTGDGRTLCGIANEGNPALEGPPEEPPPVYAEIGEYVDCFDCQRIIQHAQICFNSGNRRRK